MLDQREGEIRRKLRESYGVLESLEKMIKALYQDREVLAKALLRQKQAARTLGDLGDVKEKKTNMMVPIGGSAYIQGEMNIAPKVLIKIGSKLVVEKTREGAVESLEERIQELRRVIGEIDGKVDGLKEKQRSALAQIEDLEDLADAQ